MRYSRHRLDEIAASLDACAQHIEGAAAEARRAAADTALPRDERELAARAARVHSTHARRARLDAELLRDGYQPDEL